MTTTIISFYTGDGYYKEAADRLLSDCARLGLKCDIVRLEVDPGVSWAQICRKKIPFIARMFHKHPGGVFWIDVDTRILAKPPFIEDSKSDFGAFLRNFRDLKSYDPAEFARTFHPGFLLFNNTPTTRSFIQLLADTEASSNEVATDDYFLEEAWRAFDGSMLINLFPSEFVVKSENSATERTCFVFGDSGNVKIFRSSVSQHTAKLFENRRLARSLKFCAEEAIASGHRDDAVVFLAKANRLTPEDRSISKLLAQLYLRTKKYDRVLPTLKTAFPSELDGEGRRLVIDAAMARRDFKQAQSTISRLKQDVNPKHVAFAQSRQAALSLEMRADALGLQVADRPKVYWMDHPYPGNFGDILNPYLVEKLSGIPPVRTSGGSEILAVGSVIKFAKASSRVWGAGTPRMTDTLSNEADYRAVRGPLTRQLVQESGGVAPALYGDPAMLLPLIYEGKKEVGRWKLGLIRHFNHAKEPIELGEGVCEISILRSDYQSIESFIDEVMACDAIISTSLHGLIVAQAYGVPTRWADYVGVGEAIPGDGTKFRDHYLAFGIDLSEPLDLSTVGYLGADYAELCRERITMPLDAVGLLDAAPFPILSKWYLKLGAEGSRSQPPEASGVS